MFFKSDIDLIYTRLRELESNQKVKEANYKNLEFLFFRHDKEEIIKYDKIQNK